MAEIEKLDGKSMDIVEQNIEQLKALFPSVFSEGKIQFNQLEELLGNYVVEDEDHYNFTWHGKRKAGRLAQTPSTGTLRPCKEESVDWDNTENLFIEGDNLEVLKLLQKSYHRQVKMIYIDPPYNTGNDFVYQDDFKDGVKNYLELTGQLDAEGKKIGTNSNSAGRYHTNWLNMMYPRLKLARNLMRDDGVVFISIDDNEQDNLKKLCNEIFGEENFVDQIIWKKRYGGGAKEKFLVTLHEYILVYAKNILSLPEMFIPLEEASIKRYYKQKDDNFDIRGPYRTHPLEATKSMGERTNLVYPISGPNGEEIMPKRQWLWSRERTYDALSKGELEFVKSRDGSLSVHTKQYLKDENGNIRKGKAFSIVDDVYSQHGTNEIIELFEEAQTFSFPKPTKLLRFLQSTGCPQGGIVLDLFAGSASTADALLRQNTDDKFERKFICVQIPEPTEEKSVAYKTGYRNIADISKERIRRAAQKIAKENPAFDGDLGFKVFKLDSSNIKRWNANFDTLETDLVDAVDYLIEDRSDEDVLYELCLKLGLDLSVKIEEKTVADEKLFVLGRGYLVVCLSDNITMDLVDGIGALKNELAPEDGMRVVFKDDGFKDDVIKTNALQTLKRFGIDDIKSL